jgi:hypothetical protein
MTTILSFPKISLMRLFAASLESLQLLSIADCDKSHVDGKTIDYGKPYDFSFFR